MRFFLEKATQHLQKALHHQGKGHKKEARYHYLKASEYLFLTARSSEGPLKESRKRQAEELLRRAMALEAEEAKAEQRKATKNGQPWLVHERPQVCFDEIAGLDEVKERLKVKMVYPFTHPELARNFGVKAGGGILLYGPPGTGKTLLARAVASEIEAVFFSVKPSEVMSKWVGDSEQKVARLFEVARSFERSIIFIDEIEALIPRRKDSSSSVMQRVVPQFLTELEGFHTHNGALLFIGATNEPWSLDLAVLRPGRFDEKIYVPLPDSEARKHILLLNLKQRPLQGDIDVGSLAEALQGHSGADIRNLCQRTSDAVFLEAIKTGVTRPIEMRDFLSVLHQVKPSVPPKEVERFERVALFR